MGMVRPPPKHQTGSWYYPRLRRFSCSLREWVEAVREVASWTGERLPDDLFTGRTRPRPGSFFGPAR